MAIRLVSDLHMEFADFDLPILETDKDDVLILAGDIGLVDSPITFARVKEWIAPGRFKKVIHICGNHEYYGSSLLRARKKLQTEIFADSPDAHVGVNDEVIRVDDVSFICTTLWTDYNGGNPVIMQIIRSALNDYHYIRTGTFGEPYLRRINPHDIHHEHQISRHFIFENIKIEKDAGQKVVVVTHHAPSVKSIHKNYNGDPVNWGYVSDLELLIMDAQPNLWVHGHTHFSFDYTIENTRVVTNPRGYARKVQQGYGESPYFVNENGEFNPTLRLEV